jgi:hypothetical protein
MDRFALRIGMFNALAYGLLVGIVTYGDSHIHHIVYGVRNYPLGYSVIWLSVLIFIFTYIFNAYDKMSFGSLKINYSLNRKVFLTFSSLIIPTLLMLWINFRPEFPHMSIFQFSLGYALVIALTVHAHNHTIDFKFIKEDLISESVKIERVRLEYETWFRLISALMAAYFLLNLYIFSQLIGLIEQITGIRSEQLLTLRILGFFIYLGAFFSLFWFIELIKKSQFVKDQLLQLHSSDKAQANSKSGRKDAKQKE